MFTDVLEGAGCLWWVSLRLICLRRFLTDQIKDSLLNNAPLAFLAPTSASYHRPLSTSAKYATTIKKEKRRNPRDTYILRQIKARKDANLSRQAELREQRVKELGDPIRGIPTPFVESFDTLVPQDVPTDAAQVSLEALKANPDQPPVSPIDTSTQDHLNYGIENGELVNSLESSRLLTAPPTTTLSDPREEADLRGRWEYRHANASEALRRIVNLVSGSSKQRTKKNIQRVVETFGRHNTDQLLKPKAPTAVKRNLFAQAPERTPRAGPDTGSSEVQIGILTAKIRVLADRYEGENRNDKINKRNLRLLLHRRQKLLSYMEKKERGSGRWHNMLQILGLTPACWKGQIAVE